MTITTADIGHGGVLLAEEAPWFVRLGAANRRRNFLSHFLGSNLLGTFPPSLAYNIANIRLIRF